MIDWGKNRACGFILVVIENSSKYGFGVPLKKAVQTIKNETFENFHKSDCKLNLIETEDGKEFLDFFLQSSQLV